MLLLSTFFLSIPQFSVKSPFSCSLLLREQGFCGRMALLPDFVAVIGWGLPECCGRCSGFLDDLEGARDDGLVILFQRIAQQVLQRLGVHP